LRRDKDVPVPAVEPEAICLRVRCAENQLETIAAALENRGARNVAKLEKAV
jgi:hypothetical protein